MTSAKNPTSFKSGNVKTINIADAECWRCGSKNNLTKHHCLPQHLHPKKNILVPICKSCHEEITADDITGLYAYVVKLEKTLASLEKQVTSIKTTIENQSLFKIKKKTYK